MGNITQDKARLECIVHDATMLELITRELPEGASQTFIANCPVALTAGLVVAFVAPATVLLAGFAVKDGQNTTAGTKNSTVVLAVPGVEIEANLLGAAAADFVLLAANVGAKFDMAVASPLFGTVNAWYIKNATADPVVRVCGLPPIRVPNSPNSRTLVGDTNARVRALPIRTATIWNTTT